MQKICLMPLKWRMYYLCSLYLLFWSVIVFFVICYNLTRTSLWMQMMPYIGIFLLVFGVPVAKSILSFRNLNHYKNNTLPSKIEQKAFIISFGLVLLYAFICVILCIIEIVPHEIIRYTTGEVDGKNDYTDILMHYSTIALSFCLLFIATCDIALLKAIRKRYYDSLIVVGEGIGEHLGG